MSEIGSRGLKDPQGFLISGIGLSDLKGSQGDI